MKRLKYIAVILSLSASIMLLAGCDPYYEIVKVENNTQIPIVDSSCDDSR